MANESLLQGSQLPSTVTTTQSQTVAPEFYTNYLQDIANLGQNAVTQGGVAGLSPLQQQAFQMAPTASFAGSETMGQAGDVYGQAADTGNTASGMIRRAGETTAPMVVNEYMNPYTQNVVDEMGRLTNLNVQRNILPALKAMGVSTGGLGSTRLANVSGQTLADIQAGLTGQQYNALNQGFRDAMGFAQTDLNRLLGAGTGMTQASSNLGNIGQGLTQLGTSQQNLATTGLRNLAELGGVEQAQGQKILDYPMKQVQDFARLLQGYQVPTGTTQQVTAPGQQGQFTNAPLAQIAGLLTALGAFGQGMGGTATGQGNIFSDLATAASNIPNTISGLFKDGGAIRKAEGGSIDATGREVGTANPIQGGLQSMVQGVGPSMNPNIPVPSNTYNARLNMDESKVPALNAMRLDYQNDPNNFNLNTNMMNGITPNTNLMVG